MLQKINKYKFIILIFITIVLTGCDSEPIPKGYSDFTEVSLDKTIDSIKSGIPFAIERVGEWRDTMNLNFINVGFIGKEQIKNRKGIIDYFFYEKNITDKLDASADVSIDMNANSVIRFYSDYGTKKELGGGTNILNTDNWTIDINEAFDIAIAVLGEDIIEQFDYPKVVLRCGETYWDFAVYPSQDARYQDLLVRINPETGEVIETWENE